MGSTVHTCLELNTVGQVSQLQKVVLVLQQAVLGLHVVMHDVQGMQLLQPLQHNSVLVSNMYLTNRLSWHARCKQNTQSAQHASAAEPRKKCFSQVSKTGLECCIRSMLMSASHMGRERCILEDVPDHAHHLGLLGRSVGDALMCTRREINSCLLPYVDEPVFQVPSLGKPAPNVEANLSKKYALHQ